MIDWKERYMRNLVTLETLLLLVGAKKLKQADVDAWVKERKEKYGS